MQIRRGFSRAAITALAASAAMFAPTTSHGPAAGTPGVAARSPLVSSVLASARLHARTDGTGAGLVSPPALPAATLSPVVSAPAPPSPTIAPPPPAPPISVAAPPSPTAAPPARRAATGGWFDAAFAGRVLAVVNSARARAGLPPLAVEPRLTASATAYAEVLSEWGRLSHVGPDGSTLATRAEAAGFPFRVEEGEVLAWGNEGWTAEGVVRAWLNSPTHRAEILSPGFVRAGTGCYFTPVNGVTVYCVMDLAG